MRFFSNDNNDNRDPSNVDVQARQDRDNPAEPDDRVQSDPAVPQQRAGSPWSAAPGSPADDADRTADLSSLSVDPNRTVDLSSPHTEPGDEADAAETDRADAAETDRADAAAPTAPADAADPTAPVDAAAPTDAATETEPAGTASEIDPAGTASETDPAGTASETEPAGAVAETDRAGSDSEVDRDGEGAGAQALNADAWDAGLHDAEAQDRAADVSDDAELSDRERTDGTDEAPARWGSHRAEDAGAPAADDLDLPLDDVPPGIAHTTTTYGPDGTVVTTADPATADPATTDPATTDPATATTAVEAAGETAVGATAAAGTPAESAAEAAPTPGETAAEAPGETDAPTLGETDAQTLGETAAEAPAAKPGAVPAPAGGALFGEADAKDFQDRWREVQLRFVDSPQDAAAEAATLVDEAVDKLSASLTARTNAVSHDSADTEELRVAIRAYRDILNRILAL